MRTIYFDMDGTIYPLYQQENWLERLTTLKDASVYCQNVCSYAIEELRETIDALISRGYQVGVISWCAKNSSPEFDKATRRAKKKWLREYFPQATEVHIVKYGTNKHRVAKVKDAILVDDNPNVRKTWKGVTIPAENDIIPALKKL
jgi:5'(3')-deoxyribonucleotidase